MILSILIPVFNIEQYLAACVDSIVCQIDAHNVEIILFNDCSTDGSRAICAQLSQAHPAIVKVMNSEQNIGVSAARNALRRASKGQYIWYVDGDDIMISGAIADILSTIEQYEPDVILSDYRKSGKTKIGFVGELNGHLSNNGEPLLGVMQSRKMYCWNKIIRNVIWPPNLLFPEHRVFEDVAIIPHVMKHAGSYCYLKKPLIDYRQRAGSIMSRIRDRGRGFDIKRHEDLCHALRGWDSLLEGGDQKLAYIMSHFIAREYSKSAARIDLKSKTWKESASDIRAILTGIEQSSPISFDELMKSYLRQFRIIDFLRLRRARKIAS